MIPDVDRSRLYFLQIGEAGLIKIGLTGYLPHRLRQIRATTQARPLRVLRTTPGTRADELEWQRRFAHLQMFNEWFVPEPDLLGAIAALPELEDSRPPPWLRVATNVSREEHDALEQIASAKRVKLAAVLRWAVELYLQQHPNGEAKSNAPDR